MSKRVIDRTGSLEPTFSRAANRAFLGLLFSLSVGACSASGGGSTANPDASGGSTSIDARTSTLQARTISAAPHEACIVTTGGGYYGDGVWCWGSSDGFARDVFDYNVPGPVTGLRSGVTTVSAGLGFGCAVTAGGGVLCVGRGNDYGQLGNGSTMGSLTPVPVTGLMSGATAVSAGTGSACAVTAGGGVACWGRNTYGQLGNNSTTDSSVPVPVTGLTSGATAVSIGSASACAVTEGGGVVCWGSNSLGTLGNNSTMDSSVPVPVTGLTSGVTAVSVGNNSNSISASACAVTAGGGVACWGRNIYGQLGNNSTTDSSVPVPVTGLTSGISAVSVGMYSACAITSGGGVVCWGGGNPNFGQLGNGSMVNSSVPVPVTGLTSGATAVSVGQDFACAIIAGGAVVCWGNDNFGTLGNDHETSGSSVPVRVAGF